MGSNLYYVIKSAKGESWDAQFIKKTMKGDEKNFFGYGPQDRLSGYQYEVRGFCYAPEGCHYFRSAFSSYNVAEKCFDEWTKEISLEESGMIVDDGRKRGRRI